MAVPQFYTVAGMDNTTSLSSSNRRRPAAPDVAAKRCTVNFDKLTLVTLVIALAGFAGTAFAAAPLA